MIAASRVAPARTPPRTNRLHEWAGFAAKSTVVSYTHPLMLSEAYNGGGKKERKDRK
jgi:hypothetical protein